MRLVVNAIHIGRRQLPTAGSIDNQAAKTGHTPAHVRSYYAVADASQDGNGILVDTMGLISAVLVTAADLPDRHLTHKVLIVS